MHSIAAHCFSEVRAGRTGTADFNARPPAGWGWGGVSQVPLEIWEIIKRFPELAPLPCLFMVESGKNAS